MFTGLVEEVGMVAEIGRRTGAARFTIAADDVTKDLAVDDSVSVNGVCLTAVKVAPPTFDVEAVQETLRKTALGSLTLGCKVNLERALRFSDRLGGHLVQGHVDGVGTVTGIQSQAGGVLLSARLPSEKMKYIISEGSIAVNGVSLTVARVRQNEISIALIPHTLSKTTLGTVKQGDRFNFEVDLIGKYVENILLKSSGEGLSDARIRDWGFHT